MEFKWRALQLCAVTIFIFILQWIIPSFTEMFLLNQSAYLEVWRFVTSLFLHADIAHLLYNLLALGLFGSILEKIIGGKHFLLVFFGGGIVANLIAINFYPSSLGASGAIFGVIGALIMIRPTMMVFAFGIPMPMFIAGIVWAVGDIIGIFVPSNVGNIAHLAGLAVGLVMGACYRDWRSKPRENRLYLDEGYMRNWEDQHLR